MNRIEKNGLFVEAVLHDFLVKEALPGLAIDADKFFADFSADIPIQQQLVGEPIEG